jgi:hypothetical protein
MRLRIGLGLAIGVANGCGFVPYVWVITNRKAPARTIRG